jgi:hypothetical protein
MSAADYIKHANECMDLAHTLSQTERAVLLDIADAWLRLARIAAADEAKMAPDRTGGNEPA